MIPMEKMYVMIHLEKKMKTDTREMVPADDLEEVISQLVRIKNSYENFDPIRLQIDSLLSASIELKQSNITNLTFEMKSLVCEGLQEIKNTIAAECFEFYMDREFEVTPQTTEIMREVVSIKLG